MIASACTDQVMLILPFPPTTGNHQHIQAGKGRRVLRTDVKLWREEISMLVMKSGAAFTTFAPLSLECWIYPPDRRPRDNDNVGKMLGDALQQAGLILNDRYIRDTHIRMMDPDKKCPRLHVVVGRIKRSRFWIMKAAANAIWRMFPKIGKAIFGRKDYDPEW